MKINNYALTPSQLTDTITRNTQAVKAGEAEILVYLFNNYIIYNLWYSIPSNWWSGGSSGRVETIYSKDGRENWGISFESDKNSILRYDGVNLTQQSVVMYIWKLHGKSKVIVDRITGTLIEIWKFQCMGNM